MAKFNSESTAELGNFILNNRNKGITIENFHELKTILAHDPNINTEIKAGMGNRFTIFDLLFKTHNYEYIEFVLHNYYLNIEHTLDNIGNNIIIKACKENRADIIRAIEHSGKTHLNYNKANDEGETPLLIAAKHSPECFAWLVKSSGIEINHQFAHLNNKGLLHIICENATAQDDHCKQLFEILINQPDLKLNLQDGYGRTPIMIAGQNNNINFVERLMNYKYASESNKVDTDITDIYTNKAVDYTQDPEIIKLLGSSELEVFAGQLKELIKTHNAIPTDSIGYLLINTGIGLVESEERELGGDQTIEKPQ